MIILWSKFSFSFSFSMFVDSIQMTDISRDIRVFRNGDNLDTRFL